MPWIYILQVSTMRILTFVHCECRGCKSNEGVLRTTQ